MVAVSGTPPFSYQWKSNTVAISGATNATLTLTNVSAASAGTYAVVITIRVRERDHQCFVDDHHPGGGHLRGGRY